ncbi:MAG: acyl-CoA dehydrogenase family protein [Xanthobacteraceae bacterium]|nr:acyl-CoA dehydrogenase family protein [Xanthobacteraceae bacterium]
MHSPTQPSARQHVVERAKALAPKFAARADAAEQARTISKESMQDMLDGGFARILMPQRFGGYDLDFEAWLDVILELGRADASHAWCASLVIHHAHLLAQYPEEMQRAIWANGPDVAIAASFAPRAKVAPVEGGYRVSCDQSTFASGVNHSSWAMVGGMLHGSGPPKWLLLMVPPGQFSVRDVWNTAGMRGTGSNTIVTDNVFVPSAHAVDLADLREGKAPGGALSSNPTTRTPFFFYAPLCFAAPMLGAALGAYAHFREWTKPRKAVDGSSVAEKVSVQVRMARVAADLDAAEMLLRRASRTPASLEEITPQLLARSIRDFSRVSEITVAAMDALMELSGTAGFGASNPIQRAWRDVRFAATHISLNPENNYANFGRIEFGLPRDPTRPFF